MEQNDINKVISNNNNKGSSAYEYRMEAHAEDVIIGDYDPDKPVERNIEKELSDMTAELLKQYEKSQAINKWEPKK